MDRKQGYNTENDQLLDKLLKEDPCYFLSDDFGDKLVKRIEIRQAVKQNMIEFLTMVGVIIGIALASGGIFYVLNKEDFLTLASTLSGGYTPVIAMLALFVFFMDRVMLRLLNQLK